MWIRIGAAGRPRRAACGPPSGSRSVGQHLSAGSVRGHAVANWRGTPKSMRHIRRVAIAERDDGSTPYVTTARLTAVGPTRAAQQVERCRRRSYRLLGGRQDIHRSLDPGEILALAVL